MQDKFDAWFAELKRIRPRSIVYLFSAGKDSSLALLLTRDVVRRYADEYNAKVYIAYIYVTGNTHPANAYCASYVMLWHKERYGFEPVFLASQVMFQEVIAKYGLNVGPRRWCYLKLKEPLLRTLNAKLPKPCLHIDGMSPHDSKRRSVMIKAEFELVETWNKDRYYAWHPLYGLNLTSEEKLRILEQHEEFACVVKLYKEFGDSLNCVLCPYKVLSKQRIGDDVTNWIIGEFLKIATHSNKIHNVASRLQSPPLTRWMKQDTLARLGTSR